MHPLNQVFLNMEEYMKFAQKVNICFELEHPLGYFSLTPERFYRGNASQLRMLQYPKPEAFPLDISQPLESPYRRSFNHFYDEYLDNVLWGISDYRRQLLFPMGYEGRNGWRVNAQIVCQIQLLQTLMCTPFRLNESWLILAINYRDTLYLCLENQGEKPWTQEQRKKSAMETMLKHRVYKAYNKNHDNAPPEECSEFNYILRCQLNDLSVLYSAPLSGATDPGSNYISDSDIMNLHFVECKLGKNHRRMDGRLSTELYSSVEALKWWSEGHLKGVKNFMLALADPYGHVQKLDPISCDKLRRDNQNNWSSDFCQQFLWQFLSQIREMMKNVDDCATIYEFNYVAHKRCIYWNKGSGQHLSFIPEWYRRILEGNE
ncbi:protein cutoff-like [Drosophila serrata]|uniref:protein cutoff-like n=1 Tax=Drosophila serrata TaxID=7274 RepID=UPI000A1D05BC|nr:protein cutoff-like [Drosophila serrata]